MVSLPINLRAHFQYSGQGNILPERAPARDSDQE